MPPSLCSAAESAVRWSIQATRIPVGKTRLIVGPIQWAAPTATRVAGQAGRRVREGHLACATSGLVSTDFPRGLNTLQLKAVNEFGVLSGNSLLVVAPTSSGKTMVGEVAAIQAVTAGKKAAFLLSYRALINEKFEEFTERYAAAGLRVARCGGDAIDGIGPVLAGRYDLGFFTYETFLNLALGSPDF